MSTDNLGLIYLEKWARTVQRILKLYQNTKECVQAKRPWAENDINHFGIVIENSDPQEPSSDVVFKFLCLNPAFTFREILNCEPRSIIFTSGTLQPMDNYEQEFGMKFQKQFSCSHVIDSSKQLKVCVVKNFTSDVNLNFNFLNRNNSDLILELGNYLNSLV